MPTNKPRFMVTVSDELHQQIDNYRFENRCRSQTEAVIQLVERGLSVLQTDSVDDVATKNEPALLGELTEKERSFLNSFASLTPTNRRILLAIAEVLLSEQSARLDSQD